jgi:Leucine-rich repeat (LRR) protein
MLPERLGDCAALTTLDLSKCHGLGAVSLKRLGDCAALTTLKLSGCKRLTALPARLGDCAALATLDLSGCRSVLRHHAVVGRIKGRGCVVDW